MNQTSTQSRSGTSGQAGQGATGTSDVAYDLVSVVYHALKGAETYEQYARDAEQGGNQDVAQFFRDVQRENKQRATRGRELLSRVLTQGGSQRMAQ